MDTDVDPSPGALEIPPLAGAAGDFTLFDVIEAQARAGVAVPVAVVHSIFDDLAQALEDRAPRGRAFTLFDVLIDGEGAARLRPGFSGNARELAKNLRLALSSGFSDDLVPASAWPLLADYEGSRDLRSIALFREGLRRALGAPSTRGEVAAISRGAELLAALERAKSEAPEIPPVADQALHDAVTQTVGSDAPEVWVTFTERPAKAEEEAATQQAAPEDPLVVEHIPSRPPPLLPTPGEVRHKSQRPVAREVSVRHVSARLSNPVSIPAAPAARLGGKTPSESFIGPIAIPADNRVRASLIVGALLLIAFSAWLLGLF